MILAPVKIIKRLADSLLAPSQAGLRQARSLLPGEHLERLLLSFLPRRTHHPEEVEVELGGGEIMVIRAITPEDKQVIERAFERLSDDSRYRRFFSPINKLSAAQLRYFTEVDHYNHEALIAFEKSSGEGIGIVRYIRDGDTDEAEFAITIIDAWHGRGVGTTLIAALSERAFDAQITMLTGSVLSDNHRALGLFTSVGGYRDGLDGNGATRIRIPVPQAVKH